MFGSFGVGKESMDRATRFVQVFSFYDKYMICLYDNEENIHFCMCYQSLTIKIHLAREVVLLYRIVVIVTLFCLLQTWLNIGKYSVAETELL